MNRPNILLIYSDQHRYDTVACNGHPLVRTPNMDLIAAEGALFTHAFTPIPMCVPARCSLLTGQWPSRHGAIFNYDGETFRPLPDAIPTCPASIQQAGYHSIHIGRWHVDPERSPLSFGFHDYVPDWRYRKWRAARGIPPRPTDQGWRGQPDPHIKPEESSLAWHADQVMRWIGLSTEWGNPFFLRWHMSEPHLANHPPEPYASMYKPEDIRPWPGFADSFEGKPYAQRQLLHNRGTEGMTWEDWAPITARYLGEVTLIDHQIGRVLDFLRRHGLDENTLVIYTSDHGDMCGSHRMVDKHCVMYDDVVRVPMMMRWPAAIPAGTVVDDFVSNAVDLPATLCAAVGAGAPDSFQGIDLLPAAQGRTSIERDSIFASFHGNQFGAYSQRMVRDRRWKYVWNAMDIDELYDLETDPGELSNRIYDPRCGEELTRLRHRLADWMQQTGDALWNGATRRVLLKGRKL